MSILEPVLGGKKRFWLEKSVDNTRLVTNMAGWSLFGVAVHAWHRGIQKKALGRPLRPYFIAASVWTLLGYYIHHFELRQEELIESRKDVMRRNRGLLDQHDWNNLKPSDGLQPMSAQKEREKHSVMPELTHDKTAV